MTRERVTVTRPAPDCSTLASLLHAEARRATPERRKRLRAIRREIADACRPTRKAQR